MHSEKEVTAERVTTKDLRGRMTEIFNGVLRGREYVVERYGLPIARIVPIGDEELEEYRKE